MELRVTRYRPDEWEILDAISDCVLQDSEAVENLTRSLREQWMLESRVQALKPYVGTRIQ